MNARNPYPSKSKAGGAHPSMCYSVSMCTRTGEVLRTFPSIRQAVEGTGIFNASIRRALANGTPALGTWWRYADMPADAQPLVDSKRRGPKPGRKVKRRTLKPKEDPYAPGGRLHDLAAMRHKTKG